MILYKTATALTKKISELKQEGYTIGFVPTMGALHKGHLSLIEKSKTHCNITVCSIFVNPTQFNDPADFEKYPVTIANDILLLEEMRCDILFLPSVKEIYPNGTSNLTRYNLGEVEFLLEGKYRPGHFQGVAQVVHRLLELVQPHTLFLGQKDYQQCLIIRQLVKVNGMPVEVCVVDIYREDSGLAMSSRNVRLSADERKIAVSISKMLNYICGNIHHQTFTELEQYATQFLLDAGCKKVDYVAIVNGVTLLPAKQQDPPQKLVALIAAFVGDVRLIDNTLLTN